VLNQFNEFISPILIYTLITMLLRDTFCLGLRRIKVAGFCFGIVLLVAGCNSKENAEKETQAIRAVNEN
jgi:hypothetical protein